MRRRAAAGWGVAVALAVAGAACAPDPNVTSLAAQPVPTTTTAPPTTVAATVAPTTAPPTAPPTPPPSTAPLPTAPPQAPVDEPEVLIDVALDELVDVGEAKPDRPHDAFLAAALVDLDAWLTEELPGAFGVDWTPLAGDIWAGYPDRVSPLPGCGEPETRYRELTEYAAFYCEFGDFMVYDDGDESLIVGLADDLGPVVLGVVFAHEFGHAVQQRAGILEQRRATVLTEQQADCVSGAWVRRVYTGESDVVQLGDRDLRAGLVAMVEVRDPVGTDQFGAGGHGTAFDRVGAFQLGFSSGLAVCADLHEDPLPLMPNVFQFGSLDEILQGNAPYDCADLPAGLPQEIYDTCVPAPEFLAADLNDFWDHVQPGFEPLTPVPVPDYDRFSCPDEVRLFDAVSYCPRDAAIAYDEPYVVDLYDAYGDFTLGYFYGVAWAEVAQIRSGSTLTGEARALRADCYTGAWVADITPDETGTTPRQDDHDGDGEPDSTVVSSPGDLDEAVRMAILLGDLGVDADVVGSPFEKIAAFRVGVLEGLDAC